MPKTKMSHHDHFLQAIAEAPQDDTPRLVFADWLEEQGDPRGTLLRVQTELARLADNDSRVESLLTTQADLLRQHGETWKDSPPAGIEVTFERGLLNVAAAGPKLAAPAGQKWWDRVRGWVSALRLEKGPHQLKDLTRWAIGSPRLPGPEQDRCDAHGCSAVDVEAVAKLPWRSCLTCTARASMDVRESPMLPPRCLLASRGCAS